MTVNVMMFVDVRFKFHDPRSNIMSVFEQLWLDNLYVRLTSPRDVNFLHFLAAYEDAELWMTGVTLQGNGDGERDCDHCGIQSAGSVYAEGAVIPTCVHAWAAEGP